VLQELVHEEFIVLVVGRSNKWLVTSLIKILREVTLVPNLVHKLNKFVMVAANFVSSASIKLKVNTVSSHVEPEALIRFPLLLKTLLIVSKFENGSGSILDVIEVKVERIEPHPHVIDLVIMIRVQHVLDLFQ